MRFGAAAGAAFFVVRRLAAFLAGARLVVFLAAAFLAGARRLATFLAVVRFAAFLAGARLAVVRFLAAVRLTAFLAGARLTAFRAVVRFAAFLAGARFAVFLARLTGMLYALLTAFLADRCDARFAGGRPAAFLADCLAAFLAGARVAAFLAGARPTTFFVARPAVCAAFVAEALVTPLAAVAVLPDDRVLTVLPAALPAALPAERAAIPFGAASGALPLRTSFNEALAANRTPREAATRTGAPVCGLRPMRAVRWVGLKLPNPASTTRRPDLTSLDTMWSTALTACSASRFASDVVNVTASIRPDLFTAPPPGNAISLIKEGFRDKSKHLRW